MAKNVGFLGLGRMGFPMARHLGAAGYSVHVFDVAPSVLDRAAAHDGIVAHTSPREVAANVAVLFSALPNDDIVRDTYLGRDGVLAGASAGLITCDCSTVSPEVSVSINETAKAKRVTHMDTPMLGSSPQAESGEIFFMVGGEATAMPVIQPFLDVMGRLTMYVGASGTGNRIKLLHNALGAVNAVAVAESLALCVKLGVDPVTYADVVRNGGGMAYSTYFDRRAQRIIDGTYDATFTAELMLKDVTLAAKMAGDSLPALRILQEALTAFGEAQGQWAAEDFSAVTHVVENRVGTKVTRRS
jgi:3-hydroxyisobutyrate dehydrogenase-like beta-hydroxyacid dehydrogenase